MKALGIVLLTCTLVGCHVDGHYSQPDSGLDAAPALGSWVKHIPGSGMESVEGIALASDGSVFAAGNFEQTIDLGGAPLVAAGAADLFVVKFAANGQHLWSKRFGNASSSAGQVRIRVLSNGDLAIAGSYRGSLTFGTTMLTAVGGSDVFIARLSNLGEPLWARSGGTVNDDNFQDLAVDTNDNLALCGGFHGTGSFFGSTPMSATYDVWLARMTGLGDLSWSRGMGAGGNDDYCGVTATLDGDVVVVGNFNGTVNAGGVTFTSTSATKDMYLARYAAQNGSHRWSMAKGGAGQDTARDVESSGSSVVVTGYFSNSLSLGGPNFTAQAGEDAFTAKFDGANGDHQFSNAMGGRSQDGGVHVAVRSDGQVTIAGHFAGTADFGGMMLSGDPVSAHFAAELDATTGAVLSARSLNGTRIEDIASSTDDLAMGGTFSGAVTLLGQQFTSAGTWDGFLIVFKR